MKKNILLFLITLLVISSCVERKETPVAEKIELQATRIAGQGDLASIGSSERLKISTVNFQKYDNREVVNIDKGRAGVQIGLSANEISDIEAVTAVFTDRRGRKQAIKSKLNPQNDFVIWFPKDLLGEGEHEIKFNIILKGTKLYFEDKMKLKVAI